MFDWIRRYLRRLERIDAPFVFPFDVKQLKRFKEVVEKQQCPGCGQTTLLLMKFEDGPNGWEALIKCTNCAFRAAPTVYGFTAANIHKKIG